MAIDPRIAASGNPIAVQPVAPVQSANPLGMIQTLGQIEDVRAQVEQRRAAAEAARQKAADVAATRQAFTEANGDVPTALDLLRKRGLAGPAMAIEKVWEENTKNHVETLGKQLEQFKTRQSTAIQIGQTANAQNWPYVRPLMVSMDPSLEARLPQEFDQGQMNSLLQGGLTTNELVSKQLEATKLLTDGHPREALYTALAGIDPTKPEGLQQWNQTLKTFRGYYGVTPDMIAEAGEFSPENHARAVRNAIGPTKLAELAGQAETRAQTRAYQDATLAGQAEGRAQTAANQAASQAVARGQLDVARGHLKVAQDAEKRQEQVAPGGVKLSPTQQEDLATMMTVQQLGREALTIGEDNQWVGVGPVEGRIGANLPSGYGGTKGEALRNKIGNIQGTIAKLRGGTSFTPNEQKLLESYTPTITDSETKIKTKLQTLNEFIENKRASTLRVASGQYTLPDSGTSPPPSTSAATGGAGLTYQDYQRAKGGR